MIYRSALSFWVHWEPTQESAEASMLMQYPTPEQAERALPAERALYREGYSEPELVTDHLVSEAEIEMMTDPHLDEALDHWLEFEREFLAIELRVLEEFEGGE